MTRTTEREAISAERRTRPTGRVGRGGTGTSGQQSEPPYGQSCPGISLIKLCALLLQWLCGGLLPRVLVGYTATVSSRGVVWLSGPSAESAAVRRAVVRVRRHRVKTCPASDVGRARLSFRSGSRSLGRQRVQAGGLEPGGLGVGTEEGGADENGVGNERHDLFTATLDIIIDFQPRDHRSVGKV